MGRGNRKRARREQPAPPTEPILTSRGQVSILSYPALMEEWNYEANQGIDPAEVSDASQTKAWWRCSLDPQHEWQASPAARSGPRASGCPYHANSRGPLRLHR